MPTGTRNGSGHHFAGFADDGQRLTLASQEGRIQLALRNPLDTRREQIGATRASSLYPGLVQPVSQVKPEL